MSRNPDQEHDPFANIDRKDALNGLFFMANIHSACFWPFLHVGMGTHGLAYTGPFALLWMFAYAMMARSPLLLAYLVAWIVACIVQGFKRDHSQLSRFIGLPWLAMKIPFVRKPQHGYFLEALFVAGIGAALLSTAPAVAVFFLLGWPAMLAFHFIEGEVRRKRVLRMRDAAIEQQIMADELRSRGW